MPVTRQALADDSAVKGVQGGKQSRCAIALVVMSHGFSPPALHRQPWLGAVKGLNLALLVHAQDKGMIRRVEIQPYDILELVNEPGIPAKLEAPDQVRLQPMLFPDAPYCSRAKVRSIRVLQ